MMRHVHLRVRRRSFNAIRDGHKLIVIRRHSPYWEARLEMIRLGKAHAIAVFFCGRLVHRRHITSVQDVGDGDGYEIYLGDAA